MKPYIRVIVGALFIVVTLVLVSGLLIAGRHLYAWLAAGAAVGVVSWLLPHEKKDD